ncbi:hypothetical protein KZ370_00230 [Glaesserella parasuis]|nr:hypothetical protein [Glaesserella parasuis]
MEKPPHFGEKSILDAKRGVATITALVDLFVNFFITNRKTFGVFVGTPRDLTPKSFNRTFFYLNSIIPSAPIPFASAQGLPP